jgi:hypothetical protein
LNTPNNRIVSEAYAEKKQIPDKPECVILPKSTGLFYCMNTLYPNVETLFDITVGYSGLTKTDIPYDKYLVENCFFAAQYPKKIHIHVKAFEISHLPGFQKSEEKKEASKHFDVWLRKRFMEKDQLLLDFYEDHYFSEKNVEDDSMIVKIKPDLKDWFMLILTWTFFFVSMPVYLQWLGGWIKLFF